MRSSHRMDKIFGDSWCVMDGTLIIWVNCLNQGDLSFVCCTRIQWIDINEVLEGCQFGLRRWVPDLVVSVDSIPPSKC